MRELSGLIAIEVCGRSEQTGRPVRGAMQAWLTVITRCHSVRSDRRAVSASSESHRALSGQSTLRFRDLLRIEAGTGSNPGNTRRTLTRGERG